MDGDGSSPLRSRGRKSLGCSIHPSSADCDAHVCGNPDCFKLTHNSKYCDRSCAAIVNNKLTPKRSHDRRTELCVGCSDLVPEGRTRWCSNECPETQKKLWFKAHPCANCGSTEDLELDHIDASTKVDHQIWNWPFEKRDVELEKCQSLCHSCHVAKTKANNEYSHGETHGNASLKANEVLEIRALREQGIPFRTVAAQFHISVWAVQNIMSRKNWKHI